MQSVHAEREYLVLIAIAIVLQCYRIWHSFTTKYLDSNSPKSSRDVSYLFLHLNAIISIALNVPRRCESYKFPNLCAKATRVSQQRKVAQNNLYGIIQLWDTRFLYRIPYSKLLHVLVSYRLMKISILFLTPGVNTDSCPAEVTHICVEAEAPISLACKCV